MADISQELENAIRACNNLSRSAKAEGDLPTMYAANKAWHSLDKARADLSKRRSRMAVSNGERGHG